MKPFYIWLIGGLLLSSTLIIFNRIDSADLSSRFASGTHYEMTKGKTLRSVTSSLYFDLPTQAVPILRSLLTTSNWSDLARYYNVRGAPITRDDLMSSAYYLPSNEESPAGFPEYEPPFTASRPFPADFLFDRVQIDPETNEHVIYMSRDLKSSDGFVARALSRFTLAETQRGFQISLAPLVSVEADLGIEPPPERSPWSALKKPKRQPNFRAATP